MAISGGLSKYSTVEYHTAEGGLEGVTEGIPNTEMGQQKLKSQITHSTRRSLW